MYRMHEGTDALCEHYAQQQRSSHHGLARYEAGGEPFFLVNSRRLRFGSRILLFRHDLPDDKDGATKMLAVSSVLNACLELVTTGAFFRHRGTMLNFKLTKYCVYS